jgi:cation transport ATPase
MDERELNELLNFAEAQETAIEEINDANATGDQELTAERIARALEASCNTDKALMRAISSMNQKTRHLTEDIKEERLLISAIHDKLQDVLNLKGSLDSSLTSTSNHFKYKTDKVIDKVDDKFQDFTQKAVHRIKKSVALASFLIVFSSILGAMLAFIGLFFTINCGELFRDLWLNNFIIALVVVVVLVIGSLLCFFGFQESLKTWWQNIKKSD